MHDYGELEFGELRLIYGVGVEWWDNFTGSWGVLEVIKDRSWLVLSLPVCGSWAPYPSRRMEREANRDRVSNGCLK